MARKRKSTSKQVGSRVDTMNPEVNSFAHLQLNGTVGVSNVGRSFFTSQRYNTPQIAFKQFNNVFPHSWSEGVISDGDATAAVQTDVSPTTELNPICPAAEAFCERSWPLLQSLLQSGTGSRYPVTRHEVVRYFALTIRVMEKILFPLQLNYLLTSFPWSTVPPYTEQVPPALWQLAELFDANDVGVSDTWKPLYDRLATKILPPRIAAQVYENSFSYIGHHSGHCVRVPMNGEADNVITSWLIGTYISDILTELDYLEKELIQCHNLLASFLPWRVGQPMAMFKGFSDVFEEIDYNSHLAEYRGFNDSGDPTEKTALVCGSAVSNGDVFVYYHRGQAPTVKAVLNTPIIEVIYNVTDDRWRQLTYGKGGKVMFVDDDLNLITYDGNSVGLGVAQEYRRYWPNRWMQPANADWLDFGIGRLGYLTSLVTKEEVIRLMQRYTSYLFGDDKLRLVLQHTGGASIRTIRDATLALWGS